MRPTTPLLHNSPPMRPTPWPPPAFPVCLQQGPLLCHYHPCNLPLTRPTAHWMTSRKDLRGPQIPSKVNQAGNLGCWLKLEICCHPLHPQNSWSEEASGPLSRCLRGLQTAVKHIPVAIFRSLPTVYHTLAVPLQFACPLHQLCLLENGPTWHWSIQLFFTSKQLW